MEQEIQQPSFRTWLIQTTITNKYMEAYCAWRTIMNNIQHMKIATKHISQRKI